ncbi:MULTISPECIES: DNA polymerase IV [unclassified Roseitalea]|uniref:DNA polymerase IV n=1 Tax=unclassified Roseitalea TaxID=2639107 RepID=UPI00273D558F|nr:MULTISPECIES: DNA polymerase IV [unclassified Roseitalea]
MAPFCRDCLAAASTGGRRCAACGSPRLVAHDELDTLAIAHVDCDAFYAAVEKRDDPSLRDRPVIIGGGRRGVVSTACYIARIKGVKSAMPMFKALKACPDAVVIKPDMAKYARVGRQVRAMMEALTPLVEPLSVDEAFVDLSGTERLHGDIPARTLARFARQVEEEIGITVSVGLSYCKFLAKVASDLDKPRGFSVIGRAEARAFLARQPVTLIWGVGKAMAGKLERDGITRIGQLQTLDEATLLKRYGAMGRRLHRLSRGQDDRSVDARAGVKSISHEVTFNDDHGDAETLVPVLRTLSEKVSARLKAKGLAGRTVTLKLKDDSFRTRTRNRQLTDPTQLADRIFRVALPLLEREIDGTRYRLIGVGVAELADPARADPGDLVDPQAGRRARAERAIDALRGKFGEGAVETGYTFGTDHRGRPQRDR